MHPSCTMQEVLVKNAHKVQMHGIKIDKSETGRLLNK